MRVIAVVIALVAGALATAAAAAEPAASPLLGTPPIGTELAPPPSLAPPSSSLAPPSSSLAPPPVPRPAPVLHLDLDYGSESQFNPLTVIVSVGLMSYGYLGQDPKVQEIGSGGAAGRLVDAYRYPLESMRNRGSVNQFLLEEIVGQAIYPWYPNFFLHGLGEGFVSRKLEEYLLARDVSPGWSKVLAVTTTLAAQQLNELVEQQSPLLVENEDHRERRMVDGADSLADTFFWNVAGILAFQCDGIARLVNNEYLTLHFWPGQAVIDVRTGRIYNQFETYRLSLKIPWSSWRISYLAGTPFYALGLTAPVHADHSLTLSAGVFALSPNRDDLARIQRMEDLPLTLSVNLHWDRNGSLMTSLAVRLDLKGFLLNVYPGVLDIGPLKVGLYADVNSDRYSSAGLTMAYTPVVPGVRF